MFLSVLSTYATRPPRRMSSLKPPVCLFVHVDITIELENKQEETRRNKKKQEETRRNKKKQEETRRNKTNNKTNKPDKQTRQTNKTRMVQREDYDPHMHFMRRTKMQIGKLFGNATRNHIITIC